MVKLDNERGSICISSEVFTWLAGDAATRCFGVKGMAGRAKESGLVQLLRRESKTGVSVTPNDDGSITIELHIVVDHRCEHCRALQQHYERSQLQGLLRYGRFRPSRWTSM